MTDNIYKSRLMIDPRELYGLPLERFTAERNVLAKDLRQAGRGAEATAVTALRKPSVAAWAVNQLVRTQHDAVATLFESGDALRRAHGDVIAGRGSARALRDALAAEREAVERLTERARGLLSAEGHQLTPATLERVTETLHAAAMEEQARAQVADGCLQRALRHAGLGASGVAAGAEGGGERAAAEQRARSAELQAARKAEQEARRSAEKSARGVNTARARRDRAAQALREAETELARAAELADEAALAHRHALQRIDELS